MKYRAKKIKSGEYYYRGYKIYCLGYYEPDQKIVWEGLDEATGEGVAHGFTKKSVMVEIDYFLDNNKQIER